MAEIAPGAVIGIPCTVKPGPFSTESLISFDAVNGVVSGFVGDNELKRVSEQWYVRAVVESVDPELLHVRIRGSFFTTNGIATIPTGMALAA